MQKYQDSVVSTTGRAITTATVLVKTLAGATATIYSDDGVTTQTNPITVGSDGEYSFYAANGRYTLTITASGYEIETRSDILLQDSTDSILLDDDNSLRFGSGSYVGSISGNSTAGTVNIGVGGGTNLRVTRGAENVVNYLEVKGAAASGSVVVGAAGSDTDISLLIRSKGGDEIYLQPNSLTSLRLDSVASQVNCVQIYGGATGTGPTIRALGGDSDTTLSLSATGSGGVAIRDGGGTIRIRTNTTGIGFFNVTPIARPTTASAAATFVANAGTAVNDASTFDGYTLNQIVKALRNFGLLT